MKKLILICAAVFGAVSAALAQDDMLHITYNFSESEAFSESEVKHVLAQDDFFLVAGNVTTPDGERTVFIASYNYSGEQLWKKRMSLPTGIDWLVLYTHENLKPFADGHFALGGNAEEITDAGDTVGHPFVYIFDAAGDEVHYHQFDNGLHIELGAMNLDLAGNLLLSGSRKRYNDGYRMSDWSEELELKPYVWLGRLNAEYQTKSLLSTTILAGFYRFLNTRNVFQRPGSDLIDVAGYSFLSVRPLSVLSLDTTSGFVLDAMVIFGDDYPEFTFTPLASIMPLYDFSVQQSKYNNNTLLFSFPVSSVDWSGAIASDKLVISKYTAGVPGSWKRYILDDAALYFPLNQMLKIREAWNADILAVKPIVMDYDDSVSDYKQDPVVGRTLYIRADSSCAVYEHKYIEYFPYESTSDGGQVLQDIDQRRDSRKIVMGGYIQATEPIPGKWAAVGKTSWIVIMDDTSTTIPPPPMSVQDLDVGFDFSIYPNPGKDYIEVLLPEEVMAGVVRYEIYGLQGQLLQEGRLYAPKERIQVEYLPSGSYQLVVSTDEGKRSSGIWIKL